MLKQSPSRNQRSKGFKVKHVLQILLLLAICIWLLYQMKRSHDKKNPYEEDISSRILGKMQSGGEFIKLGRRDLHPLVKDGLFGVEKREGQEEEAVEEGRGGGDDEIDGRDQERTEDEESEGAEDLVDVEDRERYEGSEDKGIDFEDMNLLEDQAEIEESRSDLQEAREEHYKDDDDVSSAVVGGIRGISGRLRKVQVEKVDSANNEVEKETERHYTGDFIAGADGSETKSYSLSSAKSLGSENASSAYSNNAMSSNSLIKDKGNEQSKLRNGSILLLVKGTTTPNGTKLNLASNERESYLQTVTEETNEDKKATIVQTYADSTLSTSGISDSDGSASIESQGISQLDVASGAEKSTSVATTKGNAVANGEPKPNGGLFSAEESSKMLTIEESSDAIDEEAEEQSIDSADLLVSEEDQEDNSTMDDL